MTIRIQKTTDGHRTLVRLSGDLVSSHQQTLLEEVEIGDNGIALDLEEVTLVDLEIVRLLARCEAKGIELLNCPAYIRNWISRERGGQTAEIKDDRQACELERKENLSHEDESGADKQNEWRLGISRARCPRARTGTSAR